jgi:predicted ferric reductase
MIMSPAIRKLALTTHVISSVGWLGAVAGFLVLSVAGLTSDQPVTVRSAYVSMNLIGLYAIVPLSLAALLTGLIQALGTHWGLFRHYWVLAKFALSVVATALLMLHQFTAVAGAAQRASAAPAGSLPDVGGLGRQLVFDAGAAVAVLIVTATLSVYKPWGRIRQVEAPSSEQVTGVSIQSMPIGLRIFLGIIATIIATAIVVHLGGGGLGRH